MLAMLRRTLLESIIQPSRGVRIHTRDHASIEEYTFLAVQDSSIGDIVSQSVSQ